MMKSEVWDNVKKDLPAVFFLFLTAILVNRGIEIKGLYMDDLYLWSCYGEQSIFQFVFPLGSTRFRFLYYLAAWLELALIGPHVEWIVPINIALNALLAVTIYKMAVTFSRSRYVGALCGAAFLMSRMAYYQISQTYGLMETLALWLAIGILYELYLYRNSAKGTGRRHFWIACVCYFAVCFVHERYMVLLPLFFLVLVFCRCRDLWLWIAAAADFFAVQIIRVCTIGSVLPAGTGKTQVAETFSAKQAFLYALSQAAYVFGFNAGPQHLNGENFRQSPLWIILLTAVADLALAAVAAAFVCKLIRIRRHCAGDLMNAVLFLGFIAGCIACSSVTIRVEMRWVYVSFAGALLFLAWMYGEITKNLDEKTGSIILAVPVAAILTVYVVLMLPVELYYRGRYQNLYFWPKQQQYNSLAEVTYGTYGDLIFDRDIYIIGNEFEMSEFDQDTFFRVFDREQEAEGPTVTHINDLRDIGLITDQMIILTEDPEHDRYLDITLPARTFKCRGIYGYYPDGWIDESAKLQVMAGATGKIDMSFYYPNELTGDEWITVYVNDDAKAYLNFTDSFVSTSWQTQPYKVVTLRFETNFFVRDAQEKRGEKNLAAILTLTAD